MNIKITLDTGNAAFDGPDGGAAEVARILRVLALDLDGATLVPRQSAQRLYDVNGNAVGQVKVTR